MRAELRADGMHISGYVNVPGRESARAVMTKAGSVKEVIEQRAFSRAIQNADKINLLLDHDKNKVLASTENGTLKLAEDEIGLRAETVVTDAYTINAAKTRKIKGWSFDMRKVNDEIEERAGKLPLRHVKDFLMSEISLVVNRYPIYSATSVEFRADAEEEFVETRADIDPVEYSEVQNEKKQYDNSEFKSRIEKLENK